MMICVFGCIMIAWIKLFALDLWYKYSKMIFLNQNFPFAFMLKNFVLQLFRTPRYCIQSTSPWFSHSCFVVPQHRGKPRKDGHDEPFRTVMPANGCKAEWTHCAVNRRLPAERKPHGCALLWFALCQQILRRHFCLSSNHSEGAMWPLWGQKVANQEAAACRWGAKHRISA